MMNNLYGILKEKFGVSEEDWVEARKIRQEKGGATGDVLVEKNIISERQLLEALSLLYGIPFMQQIHINNVHADFVKQVPIQFLKKYAMVPLKIENKTSESPKSPNSKDISDNDQDDPPVKPACVIAVHNPAFFQPMDDFIRILRDNFDVHDPDIVLSTKEAIFSAINIAYDQSQDSAEQIVQDMGENGTSIISEIEETADLLDDRSDAPLIKLVNHIISQSIKARASDIHIEPYQNILKVRYRVDGILYDLLTPPKHIQSSLISRIKVMAKMNIAEKRLPQDGRIEVKKGNQSIDIRVSTIPTAFGERVVLRLLNKTSALMSLSDLGLDAGKLTLLKHLIESPNGIILVTGPTGSGKTTTLYAVLSFLNTTAINIITIEDPVEYQIQGISQIQVNPKIELTFARGLRSIVRQDPDVILIGEIRDGETAEIAVQSALTGHLVFSTLHTNDSASAITRLVDIGVEPFLISSSVIAVIAQRLVRILCTHCREPYVPDDIDMESIGMTAEQLKGKTVFRARGCEKCFRTGYRGRISIFEIMVLDARLKKLVLKTHDSSQIMQEAVKQKMTTLRDDGIMKVVNGVTSISEVVRVTQK